MYSMTKEGPLSPPLPPWFDSLRFGREEGPIESLPYSVHVPTHAPTVRERGGGASTTDRRRRRLCSTKG